MVEYLSDFRIYIVFRFMAILYHMDMNRFMVIRVELEYLAE